MSLPLLGGVQYIAGLGELTYEVCMFQLAATRCVGNRSFDFARQGFVPEQRHNQVINVDFLQEITVILAAPMQLDQPIEQLD